MNKKIAKKLMLARETVKHLSATDLAAVNGAATALSNCRYCDSVLRCDSELFCATHFCPK